MLIIQITSMLILNHDTVVAMSVILWVCFSLSATGSLVKVDKIMSSDIKLF